MKSIRLFLGTLLAVLVASVPASATAETWHRADTHHFVIYSDGGAKQLKDFAVELEKFDALLRMLWRRPQLEKPTRLTIYMVGRQSQVAALMGNDNVAGFYRASLEGSFAVSNRERDSGKSSLSGMRTLFHEYAHHFMYANFPIPAPAWFSEGFAEFVATAEFKKNGEFYFGRPAFHRAAEIEYFPRIPVTELLTKRQFEIEGSRRGAYYGWAWALTHMLYMDEEKKGDRVARYVNLLNRGQDSLSAAKAAFGDLKALDRRLRDYVDGRMSYSKSARPLTFREDVTVTRLSEEQSAVVKLTMKRRSPATSEDTLEDLRQLTAGGTSSADAWFQLARAEYSAAHRQSDEADEVVDPDFSRANAALDSALSADDRHVEANVLRARIMMEELEAAGGDTAADWEKVRSFIVTANRADPHNPMPLYYFAQTYQRNGETNETVSAALSTAFGFAPEVGDLRVAHAFDLANNRQYDAAIDLLKIIANDPHGGNFGRNAIGRIEAMRDGVTYVERPEIEAIDVSGDD